MLFQTQFAILIYFVVLDIIFKLLLNLTCTVIEVFCLTELQLGHPDPNAEIVELIVLNYTLPEVSANGISEFPVEIFADAGQIL